MKLKATLCSADNTPIPLPPEKIQELEEQFVRGLDRIAWFASNSPNPEGYGVIRHKEYNDFLMKPLHQMSVKEFESEGYKEIGCRAQEWAQTILIGEFWVLAGVNTSPASFYFQLEVIETVEELQAKFTIGSPIKGLEILSPKINSGRPIGGLNE